MSETSKTRNLQEREILCPANNRYEGLIAPLDEDNAERKGIKNLLKDIHSDTYSSTLYNPKFLLRHYNNVDRTTVVKTLAIALVDEKTVNRINAVWGLTSIRTVPQARRLMEDISKHYPIRSIREKASQMLDAPEMPAGCFLLGAEDILFEEEQTCPNLKDAFAPCS